MFTPQLIPYAPNRDELLALRQAVWQDKEQPLRDKLFGKGYEDEFDASALHWGLFDQGRLVAAARLSVHESLQHIPDAHLLPSGVGELPGPIGSLNRLVIEKNYQHKGISDLMDHARLEKARALRCRSVVGMTHGNRCLKLQALGFKVLCNVTPPRFSVYFLPLVEPP